MCSINTKKSIFFSQTSVRIQLYKQLGYNTYLKLLRLPLLGGQPSRLTKSFVEQYRFDSLLSQLYKQLRYKTYLKLLRLPLLGGQPSRLTKFFVEYDRFVKKTVATLYTTWIQNITQVTKVKISKNLRNLIYVILFFVISLTDCIFDAFNCWNHCIFQVLCVRHWHIFSGATADWCIQIIKCF